MKAFNDDIGKKIAIIRKSCGISAKDLSLAIGKKSNYIHKKEKVMEQFFSLIEQKMSEALKET